MEKLTALILTAFLVGSVTAAPPATAAPCVEMAGTNSLELTFEAVNTVIAGFDLWLSFNPKHITVTPECSSTLSEATVECEVVDKAVRIMVIPPYVQDIPIIESQYLATINFDFLSNTQMKLYGISLSNQI